MPFKMKKSLREKKGGGGRAKNLIKNLKNK